MGRDKIKSASLHGCHDEHVEPLPPTPAAGTRTPFETLVREMLAQLGDDPTREGLRQTPTRVEASLKWLTRGYHMAVADVIGDALYSERHENLEPCTASGTRTSSASGTSRSTRCASTTCCPSLVGPMSPTCPTAGWSASRRFRASSRCSRAGSRSRSASPTRWRTR